MIVFKGRSVGIRRLALAFGVLTLTSSAHSQCLFDVSNKIIAQYNGQSDGAPYDEFGHSVAIYGDIAVVGVPYDDGTGASNSGSAHIYHYENSTWVWKQKLTATSDAIAYAYFGYSVAIDDDIILIGAPHHQNAEHVLVGGAYVFRYDETESEWYESRIIESSSTEGGQMFGAAVAVQGNLAVGGAPDGAVGGSSGEGYAYVFGNSGQSPIFVNWWLSRIIEIGGCPELYMGRSSRWAAMILASMGT